MLDFTIKKKSDGSLFLETSIKGKALLTIAQLNKGTAFTESERHDFALMGKLPIRVETLDEQVQRVYLQYQSYQNEINRNSYLNQLLNSNQVLFYRLIQAHLKEMLPTIYTPIVGNAVKSFNKKFMNPRGLYITATDQDRIEEILDNRSNPHIQLIVVSDGEGVLGIGDQGIGAMAIPVSKLVVYTAFAGIDPLNTLPILLDAGTNNEELLNDPLYLGWRHPRLEGEAYRIFIDKFIQAIKKKFPTVFLHWEDFGRNNAYRNLITYRETLCTFNDDIQGTGVVALAAILAALKQTKLKLSEQRIVVFGAGTAGMGITDCIYKALLREGLTTKEARSHFWLVDKNGLITEFSEHLTAEQQVFMRSKQEIEKWSVSNFKNITLLEVVREVRPHILIGASAVAGAFNQEIVREMAKQVAIPIIFPLSNPTEKAEATPSDLIAWTKGNICIATGSPFDDIQWQGTLFHISQCNNYLAFPGIGLGVISIGAKRLSENMLAAASHALSQFKKQDENMLLPSIDETKAASYAIAVAVAKAAIADGLATKGLNQKVEDLVTSQIWEPHYLAYQLKKP